MIVHRFVKWCETANARQRAEGISILGRAFAENRVPSAELKSATSALMLALDDPSPKVRLALAAALAGSPRTPRPIVAALCEDTDEIACRVASLSPVLADGALIDLVAGGRLPLQSAVAGRARVSMKLAAAIAEVGAAPACLALLQNGGAAIASFSLRRLAERHGADALVRETLLARGDLPAEIRQILVLEIGQALSAMPLVRRSLGDARAQTLVLDACERATAVLAHALPPAEMPALVEHLRMSGQLSTAFLIRMVCAGNIELFAASLVALGGSSEKRVRAIVVDGHEAAFGALIRSCGLPAAVAPLLRTAVMVWKETVAGNARPDMHDVASLVMTRLVAAYRERHDEEGFTAVAALLGRLEAEILRDGARHHAQHMAHAA